MQAKPLRRMTATIPWGGGHTYTDEQQKIAKEVRAKAQDAYATAYETLSRSEKWKPGWTFDLDPSPQRVERSSEEYGESKRVVAESDAPAGQTQYPSYLRTESKSSNLEARWENGELSYLKSTLDSTIGSSEQTIEVNQETGTLTYSYVKTGEFAQERLQSPPISYGSGGSYEESQAHIGPYGVYNEWDNSNRSGGPDSVYNEWDNGRGSYYDGPDGRNPYPAI